MENRPDDRTLRRQARAAAKREAGSSLSTRSWDERPAHLTEDLVREVALECGWGRVLFGQTFDDHKSLLNAVSEEESGRRDICFYVREPHVLVTFAPQELFIDPSHTYRLWLHQHTTTDDPDRGVVIRDLATRADADELNRIYTVSGMVSTPNDVVWENRHKSTFVYLIAEDAETHEVLGTVTGIDHQLAFNDPESGSSLWCLAVDPAITRPGVGRALVRALANRFKARGRQYLDLSVMHDNTAAIKLYEDLGFVRVPVYCVKRKNPINERLFVAAPSDGLDDLNPYARILADEALRRGISVETVDAESGLMRLTHGGRTITTRESLSELTNAVALSKCDDKRLTRRLLADAGLRVPEGRLATHDGDDMVFVTEHGSVVVKPARGEQGQGITVGVTSEAELAAAITDAERFCPDVLIEEHVAGNDLRIVVINHAVVAAAIRRPPHVVGTGKHTVLELITALSRRRSAATGGESSIPIDDQTITSINEAGFQLDDVVGAGIELQVRRTANLHTGGTIHDVTAKLHPTLAHTAVQASEVLDIPVVGIDLIVTDPSDSTYAVIEANERPGLANHEPQPTAEKFIDLLFPATRALPRAWRPQAVGAARQDTPSPSSDSATTTGPEA